MGGLQPSHILVGFSLIIFCNLFSLLSTSPIHTVLDVVNGASGTSGGGDRAPEDAEKGSFKDCPKCRNKPESPDGPQCGKPKNPPADGNPYRWYRNDCEVECDDAEKVDSARCSAFWRDVGDEKKKGQGA